MADAARKAAEELQKASQAKKEGKDRESSEHTEKAARALAGAAPEKKKESGREEKKNQSSQQQNQNQQQQPSSGNPSPRPQLSPENRKGALQMLDLMGEDDKRLRSAIKKNMRMKRPQTEKDW